MNRKNQITTTQKHPFARAYLAHFIIIIKYLLHEFISTAYTI